MSATKPIASLLLSDLFACEMIYSAAMEWLLTIAALAGKHSIRINDQWRIVFRWTDAGPEDVEIIDYH